MRERAKSVGAHLEVWSEHHAGTEIELTVPASVAYGAHARRRLRLFPIKRRVKFMSGDSAPIRVLAVDDHQLIRGGIAALLLPESDMKLAGEASNGREAIARFRECRPDVTLMDLQMPEMNGFDAIIAIRNEFPEARIIVLTTYAGDVQALRAIKAGAQGLLAEKSPAQGTSAILSARFTAGARRYLPMLLPNLSSTPATKD